MHREKKDFLVSSNMQPKANGVLIFMLSTHFFIYAFGAEDL